MTKIAVNALFHASGGSLKNLQSLLHCWEEQGVLNEHQIVVFASPHVAKQLPRISDSGFQTIVLHGTGWGVLGRLRNEHVRLPALLCRHAPDVLFCPGNTAPRGVSVPTVVVFQNAAPFSPHCGWRRVGGKAWLRFRLLRQAVQQASRRADRIIVGSHDFAGLLATALEMPQEQFSVIPRAVDRDLPRPSLEPPNALRLPSRFILCVSHLQPYKNIVELIEGFARIQDDERLQGMELLIAGGVYTGRHYRERILATMKRLGCAERVKLLGDLEPATIPRLLSACELFAFPSTCENCPTALMEAISSEAVIACSEIGAMPEMAGPAARYFDPYDPSSIADALSQCLTDTKVRRRLQAAVGSRARQLDGHMATARKTLHAILQAAESSDRRLAA